MKWLSGEGRRQLSLGIRCILRSGVPHPGKTCLIISLDGDSDKRMIPDPQRRSSLPAVLLCITPGSGLEMAEEKGQGNGPGHSHSCLCVHRL